MKKIVVLTGAGISAESGVSTFRDNNGLWENHRIEEVASPIAWENNQEMVLDFYNQRRKQLFEVEPNDGHRWLLKLEEKFNVQIITQNVDDLHERAGSTNVLHLHGELKKVRSTHDPNLVYTLDHWELKKGDKCELGYQLRPHIVWFGESVPMIETAISIVSDADILIVIGTSMVVYPAASLINYVSNEIPKYYIDPKAFAVPGISNLKIITEKAGIGVPKLVDQLLKN
ncbi:MAG: NAD-dependent protein deacylase [Bacteroidetes bacterium]|jgi:NAD-dependent deacetylase|nr:NAD-dependent protein deacylase [Bacteroidota bacterium]|tara:strand:- start:2318 stop:3004 length:687 start_codon:yes stop_codon:yes gene_type:complete